MTLLWCSVFIYSSLSPHISFIKMCNTRFLINFWKCLTIPNPPLQNMKKSTLHIIIATYFGTHWCAVTSSQTFTLRYHFEYSYTCVCTALTMSVLGIKHVLYTMHPSYDFTTENLLTLLFEKSSLPAKLFHLKMCTMFWNWTKMLMNGANAASSMSLNRPHYPCIHNTHTHPKNIFHKYGRNLHAHLA
jgi:hypothetical protein